MYPDLLQKIDRLLTADRDLTESEVQHLMISMRKLLEDLPSAQRARFALLRFYADWTVHKTIDRSAEGAQILVRIHEVVAKHSRASDNSTFARELSDVLAIDDLRDQINALFARYEYATDAFSQSRWAQIVPWLAEIVSDSRGAGGRPARSYEGTSGFSASDSSSVRLGS